MAEAAAAAAAVAAAQTVVGIASSLYGYREGRKQAEAQRRAMYAQASMYNRQGDMLMMGASMQASAAGMSKKLGKANARMIRSAGTGTYYTMTYQMSEANRARRRMVGEGRLNFASRGVLVDSGAAGQWERDELADAILQKAQILRSCADEGLNVESQAVGALINGYKEAAQGYSQAASTAAQAWSSFMQSESLYAQGQAVKGPSATALGLSLAGNVMQGVGTYAAMGGFNTSGGTGKA